MLFAFAGNDAWAGGGSSPTYSGWFTYAAKIKVNETGLGKVYGSFSDPAGAANPSAAKSATIITRHRYASVTTENQSTNEFTFYLYALANESSEEGVTYEFVEWQNEKGERVANSNQLDGTASIAKFTSVNHCGPGFNSSQGTSSNNFNQEHQDYHDEHYVVDEETGITVAGDHGVDSTYVAVFRRVYRTALVKASVNDENLGIVQCNPTPFDYGTEVTLLTYTKSEEEKGFENKFIGWKKDGEFLRDGNGDIVRDVPLNFTVSEETQGHYEAVYESGYKFFHLVNKSTKRTVNAINDQGSVTDFSSLQLVDYDERLINAGSVFQINNYKVAGGYPHEFIVQGSNTGDLYTIDPGYSEYITIDRNVDDLTWSIHPNGQPVYMADEGGSYVTTYAVKEADIAHWYIECMDKDLDTAENYFSLDPNKLVEVDGKYYTTLRTSWNILFNPEQMTPYVVTAVDEENGTFEMEPITGNIIPAGTPVIIETNSNDVEENRMVPTLTNAASGAVPTGNLLQHSEKYFPNQTAPASNCKGLYKNANGQLAFGGNALSTVNGNEAYLSVANEVVHDVQPVLTETTLANLLDNGEIGPNYKITDLTCVYIQGNTLYCKDDNNALNKSIKAEGEEDYIKKYTALQNGDWDQSNWIAINLPEGSSITTAYMNAILDHRLNNVVGRLKSKINPEFDASLMPSGGDENPYNENTYITCNFSGEHQQGVVNGKEVNLFFVAPKPMEIAQVEWAMWDAASEMFIMPHAADDSGLHGAFLPNFSMLENVSNPNPQDGYGYHFPALIKLTETSSQSSAPVLAAGNSSTWTVFPLEWNTDTPTAISSLQAGKAVTRVVYYNLMGVESDKAHPGINIVVTEYSDGSRTAVKVIK